MPAGYPYLGFDPVDAASAVGLLSFPPPDLYSAAVGLPSLPTPDDYSGAIESIVGDTPNDFVGLYDNLGASIIQAAGEVELPDATSGSAAAKAYLDETFAAPITNFSYTGSEEAVFRLTDFSIPGTGITWDGGILLSSGNLPGLLNTYSAYSFSNGQGGDADLAEVVREAFPGAGDTQDAAVITFDFFVEDPEIRGLRFDIVFGSDEFSEWSDSDFVDVAAIWLDDDLDGDFELGENKALFDGNRQTPLSVISQNADNFIDNEDGSFPIEWDGFGALSVRPAVRQGQNSIKIGIADTGDWIFDSGIFVTNFEFLTSSTTTSDEIFRIVTDEENDLSASAGREELQLAEGAGSVTGDLAALNGDVITGFSEQTMLTLQNPNAQVAVAQMQASSATLDVDEDGDGQADGQVVLEGDFQGANFTTQQVGSGVVIGVDLPQTSLENAPALPAFAEGQALASTNVNGMFALLQGDAAGKRFQVTLDQQSSEAGFDNALGVYEITATGEIVDARLLFDDVKAGGLGPVTIGGVEDGHKLGFFLLSDGAAWAKAVADTDVLQFVDAAGGSATLNDGANLRLAVNGVAAADLTIFHSFQASLNSDGASHTVSGQGESAGSVKIGFEDLLNGGDMDFQDVVFQVIEI